MLQEDIAATEKIEGEGLTNFIQPSTPRHHQEETFSTFVISYTGYMVIHLNGSEPISTLELPSISIWNTHYKANASLGFIRKNTHGCKSSAKAIATISGLSSKPE